MPKTNLSDLYKQIAQIIPDSVEHNFTSSQKAFTRERKLSYSTLLTLILSLTVQQKKVGIATNLEQFIAFAKNTQLLPRQSFVHESSFSKSRKKIRWEAFEHLHNKFVKLAYSLWDNDSTYKWFGMNVFAIDGSKYLLPATKELREHFDPDSGFENKGKGHYPQCMVSTVYDVFRRIPIARVVGHVKTSERLQLMALIDKIPHDSITLLDRGYPSYEVLAHFALHCKGYYLMRCSNHWFPAVNEFLNSNKDEATITITPTTHYLRKTKGNAYSQPINVRAIKIVTPDGDQSALLTNMMDTNHFCCIEVKKLYLQREKIENYYRDEKTYLHIEQFHSSTVNGVKQELFAIVVMSVISRIIMMWCKKVEKITSAPLRFKHAMISLSLRSALLVSNNIEKAYLQFVELYNSIKRVKTYLHRKKRKNQPRICKRPQTNGTLNYIREKNMKNSCIC